ncbi:MAG: hypothetical protein EDQ89_12045 [Acidobacteria bacterium]|nr:MAG: hypothetical protein EDQ89_12045 [Acidobacteriota bacterium]MCL4286648.1 hypothetical protein [Thermoleophilia bacterium]
MVGDTGKAMRIHGPAVADRRLRAAAPPLLAVAVAVSLLSALSGGPLDALAGLPMLALGAVLAFGGSAGVETLVRFAEARGRRSRVGSPIRRRFHLSPDHAPALRLLVAGRRLRGPPRPTLA